MNHRPWPRLPGNGPIPFEAAKALSSRTGIKPAGIIIGINNNHNSAGDDDIVYTDIGRVRGVRGGEKFAIFRKEGNVSHPVSNEILGTRITPLGTLQLTDIEKKTSRAIITKTYQEVTPGAYLLPAREGKQREITLKMPARELKGYIVESYGGIVAISRGRHRLHRPGKPAWR